MAGCDHPDDCHDLEHSEKPDSVKPSKWRAASAASTRISLFLFAVVLCATDRGKWPSVWNNTDLEERSVLKMPFARAKHPCSKPNG